MTAQTLSIGLMWAVAAAGLAWVTGRGFAQITYVTLADGQRRERRLPLLYRILLPFAPNLAPLLDRLARAERRKRLDQRLAAAGFEGLLDARQLMALRVLLLLGAGPVLVGVLVFLLAQVPGGAGQALRHRAIFFYGAMILFLFVHPDWWLRRELARRHRRVVRALPFVLDLLTLSVEAGLDFMTALKRIVDRRTVDALGEEFIRVFREVQLGKTRRDALRDMAARVDQPDLRSVISALVQADELGVSVGAILRIQSDQMRTRRFLQAEKRANEAPVRMLFPLIGFIFPAVFIVLLGPVFVQFIRQGF